MTSARPLEYGIVDEKARPQNDERVLAIIRLVQIDKLPKILFEDPWL
jgi:hypothetical protein